MHKPISILLFLFLLLTSISWAQDVTGKWSGIMSVEMWWDGITGPSHKKFDITIQDNVVTGSMNGEGKLIIGGKIMGEQNCSGIDGTGELWRVAFNADGTYDVEIISPPFTCSGYNLLENEGKPYTSNNNTEGLDVHNWPIPRNRDILTGRIDTSGENPGLGKFKKHVSWTLINGPLNAVLVVTPANYNNWKPKPGMNELLKGEAMAVNLKVQGRNGGAAALEAESFEIRLTGTSSEPGTTINYPLDSLYDLPDLRLLPAINVENPDRGQSMEIECTDGSTGTFFIGSYDGGGWADLKVVAILKGGIRIEGHLLNPTGITTIPIPKRKPGSHIADSWLQANGNPGEMDDKEDAFPKNEHKGDGLTAYEEYRGVWRNSQHQRLNPAKKKLGIQSKRSEAGIFDEGISWLQAASGLEVIRFSEDEIAQDRKLNKYNNTSHDYDQFVVLLEIGDLTGDAVGETQPDNGQPKTPKTVQKVMIDTGSINEGYRAQSAAARAANLNMPYTLTEDLANTVAHELGHSIHVNHHGKSSLVPARKAYENSNPPFHIFWFDNTEETGRPYPSSINDFLEPASETPNDGSPGQNDSSGDLSCIMAYTSRYNWAFRKSKTDGSLYYYKLPLLPVGKKFCTSKTGTGINRPGNNGVNNVNKYFGNADPGAGFGNCLSQIQLKE